MKFLRPFVVFVLFYSCEELIEVGDISEQSLIVLAPSEASVLNINTINFSWNTLEDATQYHIQIADSTFTTASQIVLDTTITKTNFSKTLESGYFEWRVRAENSGYKTIYTTQSFTVE